MRLAHFLAPLALLALLATFACAAAHAGNLDPEGSVDTTFAIGAGGWRHAYSSGTVDERAIDVARLSDGTYITLIAVPGGTNGSKIGLQRFNADGSLYSGAFGSGSKVVKDAGLVEVTGLMVDGDDRILVIGSVPGDGATKDTAVLRFFHTGTDDPTFGEFGKAVVSFDFDGPRDERPIAIVEQQLGTGARYVVVGNCNYIMPDSVIPASMCVLGLTATGALATNFGNLSPFPGRSDLRFRSGQAAYAGAVSVTPDDHLLVVGTTVLSGADTDAAACLFGPRAIPYEGDVNCRTFAVDVPGPGGSLFDGATALTMDGPDRAILAGNATNRMFALRLVVDTLHTTVSKDTTFVGTGTPANVFVGPSGRSAIVADVIVRPVDGTILIAGSIIDVGLRVGAVQRLEPNGTAPQLYGGLLSYRAKTLTLGTSFSTVFVSILMDGNRPVLFGTAPDSTAADTDLDGVLTRLISSLPQVFEDGFE